MVLAPIKRVVYAASLQYVMKIMLDLMISYVIVQRKRVMVIDDEEHSVETAGMVQTLLRPSTVMKNRDQTWLKKVVNVGLTHGGTALPALYNKTAYVLIRRVLHTLRMFVDGTCPVPLRAFDGCIAL